MFTENIKDEESVPMKAESSGEDVIKRSISDSVFEGGKMNSYDLGSTFFNDPDDHQRNNPEHRLMDTVAAHHSLLREELIDDSVLGHQDELIPDGHPHARSSLDGLISFPTSLPLLPKPYTGIARSVSCPQSQMEVFQKNLIRSSSSMSCASNNSTKSRRQRSLVSSTWNQRFQELIRFREENDHCFVPHNYPSNPKLSQWVRKQRHQRKRKLKGLHSTLNDEREEILTNAGFIWDSHRAQWQERYQSLEVFRMTHGHCNVPSNYYDKTLVNWVKNQRKQFKLYQNGNRTAMTDERINLLNAIGFNWNPRNL